MTQFSAAEALGHSSQQSPAARVRSPNAYSLPCRSAPFVGPSTRPCFGLFYCDASEPGSAATPGGLRGILVIQHQQVVRLPDGHRIRLCHRRAFCRRVTPRFFSDLTGEFLSTRSHSSGVSPNLAGDAMTCRRAKLRTSDLPVLAFWGSACCGLLHAPAFTPFVRGPYFVSSACTGEEAGCIGRSNQTP